MSSRTSPVLLRFYYIYILDLPRFAFSGIFCQNVLENETRKMGRIVPLQEGKPIWLKCFLFATAVSWLMLEKWINKPYRSNTTLKWGVINRTELWYSQLEHINELTTEQRVSKVWTAKWKNNLIICRISTVTYWKLGLRILLLEAFCPQFFIGYVLRKKSITCAFTQYKWLRHARYRS
jgi:hypothetical protein